MISGSFANNDLQIEASYGFSPPCMSLVTRVRIWVDFVLHRSETRIDDGPMTCVCMFVHACVCVYVCVCVCVCVCVYISVAITCLF